MAETAATIAYRNDSVAARFLRDPQGLIGFGIVLLMVFVAITADLLTPFDPMEAYPEGLTETGMPVPPGTAVRLDTPAGPQATRFLLGADKLGRDLFTRLLFGARISLAVGLLAMLTAVGIGAVIGLLSGFFRGWVELVLMRFTDMMLTIPTLVLAIALAVVMPKGNLDLNLWFGETTVPLELINLFLVIGLVSWTGLSRIIRSETLRVSSLEYIEAARAIGCGKARILFRHVLPNVLPVIVVLASLATANTILLDAGLSYLGIGTPPPLPSWGAMINDGQPYLVTAPWLILGPGLAVVIAVLGFNLMGQGLQNAMNPHRER